MKFVILKGTMASGKSTAFHNLKKMNEMKDWLFIDFPAIKQIFNNLSDEERKKLGKLAFFSILKEIIPLNKNIITEEISREAIQREFGEELIKYYYQIKVFEFGVSPGESYKRNIKRSVEKGLNPMSRKDMNEALLARKIEEDAVLITTDNLSELEIVNIILKNLRGKR